jgi:hypothetical protein
MTDKGWLVVNDKYEGNGLEFRFINNDEDGIRGWTEDYKKALFFARREDAEQFACCDDEAWGIVEHEF